MFMQYRHELFDKISISFIQEISYFLKYLTLNWDLAPRGKINMIHDT